MSSQHTSMYVCPRCKAPLHQLACESCSVTYPILAKGIPCLLSRPAGDHSSRVREIYDEIYRHHENVWVDQGRSGRFLRFVGELAASYTTGSVLEIGCGEGAQLAAFLAVRNSESIS